MAFASDAEFILYTYFRSTSTTRVRIAARLKGIEIKSRFISVNKGEHLKADYERVNPNRTVPTLIVRSGGSEIQIHQSVAILEFLEEANIGATGVSLLPPATDLAARAHVRELAALITCDIQPPTNQRILKRVRALGGNAEDWANDIMTAGLKAFEELAAPLAGIYSHGDQVTLADVALMPAIENAVRYGVDLAMFPTINRVYQHAKDLDAFRLADWRHQDDTPVEFREK